jgi:hypothetical protein
MLYLLQEMAYATVKGFDFKYIDSNMYQSVRLCAQWIQVSCQMKVNVERPIDAKNPTH